MTLVHPRGPYDAIDDMLDRLQAIADMLAAIDDDDQLRAVVMRMLGFDYTAIGRVLPRYDGARHLIGEGVGRERARQVTMAGLTKMYISVHGHAPRPGELAVFNVGNLTWPEVPEAYQDAWRESA